MIHSLVNCPAFEAVGSLGTCDHSLDELTPMDKVREAIMGSSAPLIVGHVTPDADCIASILVMQSSLQSLGKSPKVLLPLDTVAKKFRFMLEMIRPGSAPGDGDSIDLIIVVDTALRDRINVPGGFCLPSVPICNIDHHLGNEQYGDVNWVEQDSASTSQMVYAITESLGATLSSDEASLLYAGLHGDTCGFSLRGTSQAALSVAADLAERGAEIEHVCRRLCRSLTMNEFRLMQLVYSNTRCSDDGQLAWSTVRYDELIATGCGPDDIDEQVSVPRSIDGVKIAVLFSERKPGRVRLNLRSEEDINILPLARSLGGGGHAHAAGVIIEGPMDATVDRVIAAVGEFLRDRPGGD